MFVLSQLGCQLGRLAAIFLTLNPTNLETHGNRSLHLFYWENYRIFACKFDLQK